MTIGLGVSGTGGAVVDRARAFSVERLPGAAGFFLAAFFLADFSVGFFLPDRPVLAAPFAARFALVDVFAVFLLVRARVFAADLRPAALPAGGRVSFFFLPDFVAGRRFAAFPVPAFFLLAMLELLSRTMGSMKRSLRLAHDVSIQRIRIEGDLAFPRHRIRHGVYLGTPEFLLIRKRAEHRRVDEIAQIDVSFQAVVEAQP
ncbi:MAG TPA: hypothetical protein VFB75_15780 [Burkholderiales bacterium]|nr:hypothetical protein [Burkholderiales bacterium]